MSSVTQNVTKKSKPGDYGESDMISRLPDEILIHIMSFLQTKYAVRTSLLSTRWKTLWMSVPTIDFNHLKVYYPWDQTLDAPSGFMDVVDRIMLLRVPCKINKFHLRCYGKYNTYRINSWICAAIKLNVQDLLLSLNSLAYDLHVELPRSLFTSINLVVLMLSKCVLFRFPMPVFLPSLKVLHLDSLGSLNDDIFKNLLSGCPVIEELEIRRRWKDNIKTLCIFSTTLKKLLLYSQLGYKDEEYHRGVVIKAPSLKIFRLNDYYSEIFDVDEFPSLVKAELSVWSSGGQFSGDDYCNGVVGMLEKVSNVQHLKMCSSTLKVIIQPSFYEGLLFDKVTHLDVGINDNQWSSFPELLRRIPNLKTLLFKRDSGRCYSCLLGAAPESVPNCVAICLETVAFGGFSGCKHEMKLLRYFLANAMVLKKLTLWSCTRNKKVKTNLKKIKANLQKFPRGSSSCQIQIEFRSHVSSIAECL